MHSTSMTGMDVYVALLRGINVGGNNMIKMADLKACFEANGFRDVSTYIASGNVLFRSSGSRKALTGEIEKALSRSFPCQPRVVVRSFEQMRVTVDKAPKGFGRQPKVYRYDVVFLREPLTPDEAMKGMKPNPAVDRVFAGETVLYCSKLIELAAQSHLTRAVGTPAYQSMTARNWNTTTRLFDLMTQMAEGL